jgi:hypothetical protein
MMRIAILIVWFLGLLLIAAAALGFTSAHFNLLAGGLALWLLGCIFKMQ